MENDDSAESRILNVIMNILIINKQKWRQQLGRAIKRVFTIQVGGGDWVERK